jgi:hypothetical protein
MKCSAIDILSPKRSNMKRKNQLLGYLLLGSTVCMGQGNYWASNMQLYPMKSSKAIDMEVSVSGGFSTPRREKRPSINAVSTTSFWANVYLPTTTRKGFSRESSSVGFYVGFGHGMGYGNYNVKNFRGISISGQLQAPLLVAKGSGGLRSTIFSTAIGIQGNIYVGRLLLSPIVSGGFLQLRQQKLEVEQTTTVQGSAAGQDTAIRFNLFVQDKSENAGMAFLPKLRLGYTVGRLGFWAEGQYSNGPIVRRPVAIFVPQGPANPPTGGYTLNQIRQGRVVSVEGEAAKYQSWGISLGASWRIPRFGSKPRPKCTCGAW